MLRAVTAPVAGPNWAFQPEVMAWPAGSVKVSAQPLIAALPVLVMVMLAVSPVFQALTVSPIRQAGPPRGGVAAGGRGAGGGRARGGRDAVARDPAGVGPVGLHAPGPLGEPLVPPVPLRPKKAIAYAAMPGEG